MLVRIRHALNSDINSKWVQHTVAARIFWTTCNKWGIYDTEINALVLLLLLLLLQLVVVLLL
jgi:hypothetical protein